MPPLCRTAPQETCRTCLKRLEASDVTVKLNNIEAYTMLSVARKLKLCIPEMIVDDNSEGGLCSTCNYMLEVCYKFRTICLKTEQKLQPLKPNAARTSTASQETKAVESSSSASSKKRKRSEESPHPSKINNSTRKATTEENQAVQNGTVPENISNFPLSQFTYLKTDIGYIPIMNANVCKDGLNIANPSGIVQLSNIIPAETKFSKQEEEPLQKAPENVIIDDDSNDSNDLMIDDAASSNENNKNQPAQAPGSPLLDVLNNSEAPASTEKERRLLLERILKHNPHLDKYTPENFECSISIEPLSFSNDDKKDDSTLEYICQCNHCGDTFTSQVRLLTHIRKHFNYKPHKCKLCDRSFYEPSDLQIHMSVHDKAKAVEAKAEAEKQKSTPTPPPPPPPQQKAKAKKEDVPLNSDAIDQAMRQIISDLQCRFCEITFNTDEELETHFENHCKVCFKFSKDPKHLAVHRYQKDASGRKIYYCLVCKKFHRRLHFFAHTNFKNPYVCLKCNQNCKGYAELKRHTCKSNNSTAPPKTPKTTPPTRSSRALSPNKTVARPSPAPNKSATTSKPIILNHKLTPTSPVATPKAAPKSAAKSAPKPKLNLVRRECKLCKVLYNGEHLCIGRKEYRCEVCTQTFLTVALFIDHTCAKVKEEPETVYEDVEEASGPELVYNCEMCKQQFHEKDLYDSHECYNAAGERLITCQVCAACFPHREFVEHVKVHIV